MLLVLELEDFRNFLAVVPEVRNSFERIVTERTAEQFTKFNVPFFASIPHDRFKELADLCEMLRFEPGAVIFNEGDPGTTFYLIVYGELT